MMKQNTYNDETKYIVKSAADLPDATEITIPDTHNGLSVTSISSKAFAGLSKLKKVTLPQGLESIYDNVFLNCTQLSEINLEEIDSLKYVENSAFNGTQIYQDNLKHGVFCLGKFLLNADNSKLEGTYQIPDGIVKIATMAFYNCTNLTGLIIPKTLQESGSYSFFGCTNLKSIKYQGSSQDWKSIKFGLSYGDPETIGNAEVEYDCHDYDSEIGKVALFDKKKYI